MSNKNCNSCDYCDYCDYCNYCNSCDYCDSCDYCNSCNSCNSCYSCNYCNYCNYCYSCNYCNYCKGLRMSERMIFCLGEGKYEPKGEGYQKNTRIFNKDVSEDVYSSTLKNLRDNGVKIALTQWVDEKNMSDDDKKKYSLYKQLGGCLKVFSYEDAWATWWKNATQKQRNAILDIPQFDRDIFKGITGIDVQKDDSVAQEAIKLLESKGYKIVKIH